MTKQNQAVKRTDEVIKSWLSITLVQPYLSYHYIYMKYAWDMGRHTIGSVDTNNKKIKESKT